MGSAERLSATPVTLVTGFLGAGKTTLVNHILAEAAGRRVGVIENEFGDLGIDSELIAAPSNTVFALNEGCVCCSVQSDLVAVFEGLAGQRQFFDHIVIEASGLADPGPVMQAFERSQLGSAFRLDGVVTVVDAQHVEQDIEDVQVCAEQITYADLLVLNKADKLSESRIRALEARLERLNPIAHRLRSIHARVPVEKILQIGVREFEEAGQAGRAFPRAHGAHRHDDSITSVAVQADGDIDLDSLDRWLGFLVRREDMDLLRMKGLLAVPGQARRFVFHGVRDVVDVIPGPPWGVELRANRAVFIGRGLDDEQLRRGFLACLESSGGLQGQGRSR
ncbi:MAG: hypothetical protein CBC48_16460 [bacterium TMED88]|nr:cobalamin biosynthesis protein CobW [Deltaproteobacteria bacterium]OUV25447.1 MAG: hypothetical protein CBC48_16460 [bacterium TMED88]